MPEIKFGTDGWRALIARDFTFDNCRVVAQGIASYIKNQGVSKKGIIIGYDNRFLSEDFAAEVAQVLIGNGIKVFLFKKSTPTPVTAFAIRLMEAGGAVMITASHNPHPYNGIKFIPEYAGPALPDVTQVIEEEIKRVLDGGRIYELELSEAYNLDLIKEIDVDKEYISHLMKAINKEFFKDNNLKVLVDPMFGAGIGYLDRILGDLGCEVRTINNYRDPLFGGSMPEPTDAILSDLKRAMNTYKADIGLALDGDADRFGIVNKEGEFITPNQIISLLLDHLIKTRSFRGPVARSIATTHMLDRIARRNSLEVIETPVGFKYIGECQRERNCLLGAEESGGLSIYGHIPEKDGILACLLTVEMLAQSGKGLNELMLEFEQEYGRVVSRRLDLKVKPLEKAEVLKLLKAYEPKTIAGIKVSSVLEKEGKKVILEDGSWFLMRSSGTEAIFRLYVESENENRVLEIQKEVLQYLELA